MMQERHTDTFLRQGLWSKYCKYLRKPHLILHKDSRLQSMKYNSFTNIKHLEQMSIFIETIYKS